MREIEKLALLAILDSLIGR